MTKEQLVADLLNLIDHVYSIGRAEGKASVLPVPECPVVAPEAPAPVPEVAPAQSPEVAPLAPEVVAPSAPAV